MLYVCISCDADPDRESYGGAPLTRRSDFAWKGITEGITFFNNNVRKDSMPVTWFARSDIQLDAFLTFEKLFFGLRERGDEIAWHVHFWRWHDEKGSWFQETKDKTWLSSCVDKGFSQLPKEFGIESVKSGWGFHNEFTLCLLSERGLRADFSCVPDLRNVSRTEQGLPYDVMDWVGAPIEPYHPHGLSILEVPNSTYPYGARKIFTRFLSALPQLIVRRRGFASVATQPQFFQRVVDDAFKRAARSGKWYLLSYFHPDCLLAEAASGLYENRDFLVHNLKYIEAMSQKTDVPVTYVTGRELSALWSDQGPGAKIGPVAKTGPGTKNGPGAKM